MASIERTAYPRFKRSPVAKELEALYTPSDEELSFAFSAARKVQLRFGLLLLLKSFQRLGYFPAVEEIPPAIVQHVRVTSGVDTDISPIYTEVRTLYRHHQVIRERLGVSAWGDHGLDVASESMAAAAEVMDNPADLINVAIEELVHQRIELPAFSTLDRLSRRIRTLVNGRFFVAVMNRLSETERGQLDALLEIGDSPQKKTLFFALKQLPKRSSLEHLQDLLDHIVKLSDTVGADHHLMGIPYIKIKHFAAEAKVLDAAELKKFTQPKRYVLVLSLIHRARVQARDDLADMFIKRMSHIHRRGKDELERLRVKYRQKTEHLVATLADVIQVLETQTADEVAGKTIRSLLTTRGGTKSLQEDCDAISAFSGDNYFPLLWRFYRSHRPTLFRMAHLLTMTSTSEDKSLMDAVGVLLTYEIRKGAWIDTEVDFSFANERWKRTVLTKTEEGERINRQHFEVCVFSALAAEIKSGDVSIQGSEAYADYRDQLLSWEECEPLVANYCQQLGFPDDASGFTDNLRNWLTDTAVEVDTGFPDNKSLGIDESGLPILKRSGPREPKASARALETALLQRLPERNVIDVLCNVAHWTSWNRHFGPLSGSDPKIENPGERYILTTFTYGCNLGPAQASRHLRGAVTPHMLSFVNRRHANANKLNAALKDIINRYHAFELPKVWGEGKSAAADGTKFDMFDQNLLAEYHIRYGGYGGIAYHHVADNYVALFSHFIPCGVWEAVYIIEGLLQNKSDIQPDTVHADTQGQSAPVFALAYLLGIKLMPRIRNWHDLVFFRPTKDTSYQHIDMLFKDVVDWELIETHWKDLLRVVLSIKAGKISSSTLLRKLGNYSRKNRLYQAFRELGRVVRTALNPAGRDAKQLLDEAERRVFEIAEAGAKSTQGFAAITPLLGQVVDRIQELYDKEDPSDITGVATGFHDLDKMTSGLQPGDMVVIAGRPSMGKTSIALNVAEHVGVELRLPVAIFSLEMSGPQIATRLLSSVGRLDQTRTRNGRLTDEDWDKMTIALGKLHDAPIHVDETGALTATDLRARARRLHRQCGKLGLIVIDYIQLMTSSREGENRATEISEISRSIKALAKVFRAKVLAGMAAAGLRLPGRYPTDWVVDCKSVGTGASALIYLGRYLYRGVIREQDIVACGDGQVTFRYRHAKTGRMEQRTVSGADFLWLVLQHVLPKGFRRARNFGFLHPNCKRLIALLHLLLRFVPRPASEWVKVRAPILCACCGAVMTIVRTRIPPTLAGGPATPPVVRGAL